MSKLFGFKYEKKEKAQAEPTPDAVQNDHVIYGEADEADVDTVGQTETFFTRNVRLITFLICIAVFLAVLGPISVFRIVEYIEENQSGETLTVEEILAYAERHESLKLSDFEDYEKEVSEGTDAVLYTIKVGTDYLVMIGAAEEDAFLHYFTVTNLKTDEMVDVMATTYSAFLLEALLGR